MWILAAVLHVLYYISPAYCANAFAVFGGGKPIDFGLSLSGRRILGDGKTWRGLFIGLFFSTLFGFFWFSASSSGPLSQTYYNEFNFHISNPLFGFYLGLGALLGDISASFLKRRLGIPRGQPLWVIDQLDFVFGALLFAYLFGLPLLSPVEVIILLIITPAFHLFGNFIAYHTKKKVVWW